jgi:circadian clock protein KaiC
MNRAHMTEHELNAASNVDAEIKRLPTHIAGLDTILCGGLLSSGVYLIQGLAGSGKTVLASQIIYSHAAQGSRALFVTVLGENHGRMMAHLRPMRFFDQSLVPDRVTYISAYQALDENKEGLGDLTALLAGEVRAVVPSEGTAPPPDRTGQLE